MQENPQNFKTHAVANWKTFLVLFLITTDTYEELSMNCINLLLLTIGCGVAYALHAENTPSSLKEELEAYTKGQKPASYTLSPKARERKKVAQERKAELEKAQQKPTVLSDIAGRNVQAETENRLAAIEKLEKERQQKLNELATQVNNEKTAIAKIEKEQKEVMQKKDDELAALKRLVMDHGMRINFQKREIESLKSDILELKRILKSRG